jgi:6-pyruvoyltetrahydropterin/6-carboxytetrahydropterin synthase
MKISKQIKWEAGHRLAHGYPGNCQHVHGHSYIATIEMELVGKKLNQFGFVKDFGDFKQLKNWVDDNWDHAFLVANDDTSMLNFLKENKQRLYIFAENPTAEYIAQELFEVAKTMLNDQYSRVVAVKVNETATSEAVYQPKVFEPQLEVTESFS